MMVSGECVRPPANKDECIHGVGAVVGQETMEEMGDTPGADSSTNKHDIMDKNKGLEDKHYNSDGNETPNIKVATNPSAPTQEEVEQHCIVHLPYRTWCPHCVRGKGRDDAHNTTYNEHRVPTLSIDYGFF